MKRMSFRELLGVGNAKHAPKSGGSKRSKSAKSARRGGNRG